MFCSSLRKRPGFASLPATLLSLQNPKWKESNLESHDLGIPVPLPSDKHHMFNIFLLSGHDMQPPMNAVARVERLYHKTGGRDLGVIFLLQENPPHGNGTTAFMELQMK